jgi:hypothetical protein
MTTEEEKTKNIDQEQNPELVKDSKISSKDDSLNKKMQEMYAESKKEVKTNQRPQSKYHRDRVPSGKRETEPKKEEHIDIDEDELIKKINEHFEKKQITKKEFSDNQNVFLPMDEFFELFKNTHLDLNENEIKYLFSNKNPNKDDGYIYFNTFLDNYEFKFYPGESTLINKSNTDNQSNHSNYTSLLLNKPDKISPDLQNEFNVFKNDILNIVEESKNPHTNKKRLPPLKKEIQPGLRPSSRKTTQQHPSSSRREEGKNLEKDEKISKTQGKENISKKKPQSAFKVSNYSKKDIPTTQKKHKVNYLKQTLQRMQLEDEMIRLTIDKRDKEFQRDCVKKMVLANEYAEKLGIAKSFSAFSEEGENTIICRVFSKTVKDYKDINLKQFLIEFKKLEKMINQKNEREKYQANKDNEMIDRRGEEDFFKMDRSDKHKIIKKILKESIQLKLQLKKQLKALRDKKLIDLDTLNKNLKLTNLDDDTII